MELNISRLLITLIKKSCCALMDRIKNVLIVQHPHFPHIKSNGTVLITVQYPQGLCTACSPKPCTLARQVLFLFVLHQ